MSVSSCELITALTSVLQTLLLLHPQIFLLLGTRFLCAQQASPSPSHMHWSVCSSLVNITFAGHSRCQALVMLTVIDVLITPSLLLLCSHKLLSRSLSLSTRSRTLCAGCSAASANDRANSTYSVGFGLAYIHEAQQPANGRGLIQAGIHT